MKNWRNISIALVCVSLSVLFFIFGDKGQKSSDTQIKSSNLEIPAIKGTDVSISSPQTIDFEKKVAEFLAKKLTSEEEKQVSMALINLDRKLRRDEIHRSELVKVTNHPETNFILIKIAPPSNDELQSYSQELSTGLSRLEKGGKVYNIARERGTKSIQEFTAFPKPFKYLQVTAFKNGTTPQRLGEVFMDKSEYADPDQYGGIVIHWGRDKYRGDDNFGVGNSWSNTRYSHIPELWSNSPPGDVPNK